MHKLTASIHEDDLETFEAWFAAEFAGGKDGYSIESFAPAPNSSAVLYSVSFKVARQTGLDALKAYLAGLRK